MKIIIFYDAEEGELTILDHNVANKDIPALMDKYREHYGQNVACVYAIKQKNIHDVRECEACNRIADAWLERQELKNISRLGRFVYRLTRWLTPQQEKES